MLASGALILPARLRGQARSGPSVQDVLDRIRAAAGVPPRGSSADGVKAGDPSIAVTGIAVVAMPTIDLLRRAAAAGANLIVTTEPTFYTANDEPGPRAGDSVYLAKKALIDREGLVIYRFSGPWTVGRPTDAAAALAGALGWWTGTEPGAPDGIYQIPEMTLDTLKAKLRATLPLRGGLRMVGAPTLRVRSVFLSPGTTTLAAAIAGLQRADAIVTGEPREWEAVPYVLDTAAGHPKGMLHIGRVVSEGPAVPRCASWIAKLVPEVRVQALDAQDPYWSAA